MRSTRNRRNSTIEQERGLEHLGPQQIVKESSLLNFILLISGRSEGSYYTSRIGAEQKREGSNVFAAALFSQQVEKFRCHDSETYCSKLLTKLLKLLK